MFDNELAIKYKPNIYFDSNEPFEIKAIGYTIFRRNGASKSFPKRMIEVNGKTTAFVIEYAIWFDYDIQHLYELEHVWVFIGFDGAVIDAEGSFHGKYLKEVDPKDGKPVLKDSTHVIIYSQPGKHAMLPRPELVRIIPNWYEACNSRAGEDGMLIPEIFQGRIEITEEEKKHMKRYIKEKYSFVPTLNFVERSYSNRLLTDWDTLYDSIPMRLRSAIDVMDLETLKR